MSTAGTPGLSLGVHTSGCPPYFASFGTRDASRDLPVSQRTVFPACSLTKLFVAAALARAVDEGRLAWEDRVKDRVPGFHPGDETLREETTVEDVLAHRSGMAAGNFFRRCGNEPLVAHADGLSFINERERVAPFRQGFLYNNLGFELAGLVLDGLYGSWARKVRESLLEPLGMHRTFTGRPPPGTEDVVTAYGTLDDGRPVEVPTVRAGERVFGSASGGMFSCVEDLLRAYAAVVEAMSEEGGTSSAASPIKRHRDFFSAMIAMAQTTPHEASYTLGLCRVSLPGPMGQVGINPGLMPSHQMPTVARGISSPRLVLYHQGSLSGALSAMAIIPSLRTAVVVMTNSLALNDCPDWVLQLLLEEILQAPQRNDFLKASRVSAASNRAWYARTAGIMTEARIVGTTHRPLEAYVGTYWNEKRYLMIRVTLRRRQLSWALQDREDQRFELYHYEYDTFEWLKPRNYLVARGRWIAGDLLPSFWKLCFKAA